MSRVFALVQAEALLAGDAAHHVPRDGEAAAEAVVEVDEPRVARIRERPEVAVVDRHVVGELACPSPPDRAARARGAT